MELLKTENLHVSIEGKPILQDIHLAVPAGCFVGVIGPNGSGKSTLLKTIYRVNKPTKGAVYLNGRLAESLSGKEAARLLAALPQENEMNFDLTVMEVLLIGRYAHQGLLGRSSVTDKSRCQQALEQVGMCDFENRSFLSLSGGEKQRVLIAAAFCRETPLIVLDEPTNHLDIGYQFLLMELMKNRANTTVFASVHDLNLAIRYCDQLLVLHQGTVVARGTPQKVLTAQLLRNIFKVEAVVEYDAKGAGYIRYTGAVQEKPA